MTEKEIGDLVLAEFPFVFRNDNGRAVVGGREFIAKQDGVIHVKKGQRVVIGGSPIKYGLLPGSGDFVGWTQRDGVAIFTSIEVKTEHDQLSKKQKIWRDNVRAAGGIAEIWHERAGEVVKE